MTNAIACRYDATEGIYLSTMDLLDADIDMLVVTLPDTVLSPHTPDAQWQLLPHAVHPWPGKVLVDLYQADFSKRNWILRSPLNGQKYSISWQSWLAQAMANLDCFWLLPSLHAFSPQVAEFIANLPNDHIIQFCTTSQPHKIKRLQTLDAGQTWLYDEDLIAMSANGHVFNQDVSFCVLDRAYQFSSDTLAPDCPCQACMLNLTRSYFHHIHQHVPLLSSRYLMLHNLVQMKFSL